jgi:hypothetical protein
MLRISLQRFAQHDKTSLNTSTNLKIHAHH